MRGASSERVVPSLSHALLNRWFDDSAHFAIIKIFFFQVLPLENKIKKPGQMMGPFGILSCGIGLSTLLYACVGFLGYLAFGNDQNGSILEYLQCYE